MESDTPRTSLEKLAIIAAAFDPVEGAVQFEPSTWANIRNLIFEAERELSAAKRELAEARNGALEEAAEKCEAFYYAGRDATATGFNAIYLEPTSQLENIMGMGYAAMIRALKSPAQGETSTAPQVAQAARPEAAEAARTPAAAVPDDPVAVYNSLAESSPWPDNMNAVVMRKLAAHYEARGMIKERERNKCSGK